MEWTDRGVMGHRKIHLMPGHGGFKIHDPIPVGVTTQPFYQPPICDRIGYGRWEDYRTGANTCTR